MVSGKEKQFYITLCWCLAIFLFSRLISITNTNLKSDEHKKIFLGAKMSRNRAKSIGATDYPVLDRRLPTSVQSHLISSPLFIYGSYRFLFQLN
jgi:hypothetical protein